MKMRNKLFLFVAMALAFLFSACSAQSQAQFVELPTALIGVINGLFLAVFALLFDFLIGYVPALEFFRQYREAWALVAANAFVVALQNWLPTGYEDLSITGVSFAVAALVAIVAWLGGRTLLARRVKAFR